MPKDLALMKKACCITFRVAAVLAALVALIDSAIGDDLLELRPGETVIITPSRPVQGISIGNPNIAFPNPINLSTITITAKIVGTTNMVLFDQFGRQISNTIIQVVAHADILDNPPERREVKVFSGVTERRAYLCSQNCSEKPRPLRNETAAPPTPANSQGTVNRSETIITRDGGQSVTSFTGPAE
jgi:hypothetical protein